MKKSPLAIVKDKFGGREKLVEQLTGMVDDLSGEGNAKSRLSGLSNQKLLRLYRIEQTVRERFGDRDKMIQHIVDARKKAGKTHDADFIAKIATYSKGRLLDMTRERHGEAAVKWTPEQKLKSKRGKKQRARAAAKIG